MAVEERKCNGFVKLEESPGEELITYKRRKRSNPSAEGSQVLNMPLHNKKNRDIGWEHGMMVDGNRFHWKCNWCGFTGHGGGVSRLKQHLAGNWHVRKCPMVPNDIATTIMKHLTEKRGVREKRLPEELGFNKMKLNYPNNNGLAIKDCRRVDSEIQMSSATQLFETAIKESKIGSWQSRTVTQRSRATFQLFKTDMTKRMKKHPDKVSCNRMHEKDNHAGIDNYWRNVLEHILQLPDVREGGGIQNCIRDALTYGPCGFTRKFEMIDAPGDSSEPKDRYEGHCEAYCRSQRPDNTANSTLAVAKTETHGQVVTNANTVKCQTMLLDIFRSDKFVLLCALLCGTFQDNKAKKLFDFSLVNSKMKNGDYEQSPGLFDQDMQQIWEKFQRIGQEMVLLASTLSNMSRIFHQKQVGEDLGHEAAVQKPEDICHVGVEQKNSMESYTTSQFTSYESDRSIKPDQTVASCLYKACTCTQCGAEVDRECSLICDGCEAVYHFACVEPAVDRILTPSWYCASCNSNSRESLQLGLSHIQEDSLHQTCVVCDRLESEVQEQPNESGSGTAIANDSRESSVSSMESDEPPELSRTAMSCLCKLCGTCEDEDKRFLVCGHIHCPYKFYHIRCLKSSQIASPQQQNRRCWYCPSCLCRSCLCDKDDDKIVLCDGCDEAYHTYCMKPPRTNIPKGQWYCVQCNMARAREGMRKYEQWILQQHRKNDVRQANEAKRSMDLLLSAAEKLSSEELIVAGKKQC